MSKAYVILEKGYEYDDNIYNQTDGGDPRLICFSKEDAEQRIKDLNIKEYKTTSIRNYAYDVSEILNVDLAEYEAFQKEMIDKYGKVKSKYSWDSDEFKLHESANEEEALRYQSMVDISFYEYKETDIDVQSHRDKKINDIL